MNTIKSDQKAKELKEKGPQYLRRVITHRQTFNTTPEKLFPLLCPTTEYDWIDGWDGEVIYSKSGYQEYNLIFRTDYFNIKDEVWVISHLEPNKVFEVVRVSEHLSIKVDVTIHDNLDGTCEGDWVVYATALTPQGNKMLSAMDPKSEPIGILVGALDHYINHDEIMPLPDGIFNKKSEPSLIG